MGDGSKEPGSTCIISGDSSGEEFECYTNTMQQPNHIQELIDITAVFLLGGEKRHRLMNRTDDVRGGHKGEQLCPHSER